MSRHRVMPDGFDPDIHSFIPEDVVNWAVDMVREGLRKDGVLPPRRLALRALAFQAISDAADSGELKGVIERAVDNSESLPCGYRVAWYGVPKD